MKEEIKTSGRKIRDGMATMGAVGEEVSACAGKLFIQTCKVVNACLEAGYQELGGTEGVKKAIRKAGKGVEALGKFGVTAGIALGKAAANIAAQTNRQIKDNREERETKMLDDVVYRFVDSQPIKTDRL